MKDEDTEAALIEALAAWDHRAWAGWTQYLLDHLTPENIARWRRQIATPYAELSEREKDADRQEAREILAVVKADPWLATTPVLRSKGALVDAFRAGFEHSGEGYNGEYPKVTPAQVTEAAIVYAEAVLCVSVD